MQSNHGFTLIEVIFSISVIIILSLFTLQFAITSPIHLTFDQQCLKIISLLQEAKSTALINHKQITITINRNYISYDFNGQHKLTLDKPYYFSNNFELYFNKNGNINAGNTLNLCNQQQCRQIVFNVGSGAFYVKD